MALHEACGTLCTVGSEKVIFILDASESAASHQTAIIGLMRDVLAATPMATAHALYFLGNPVAYTPDRFTGQAIQWFQENQQRASLVTPIWGTLDQHAQYTFVIIGSGRIFDLEDWEGTPWLERTLLVSLGDSLQHTPAIATELTSPTAQQLCRHLHDPAVKVEIAGPGFMPMSWDNAVYSLHLGAREVALNAELLGDFSVTLRYLAMQEDGVKARVTHASGKRTSVPLIPVDPTGVGGSTAGLLSVDEAKTFLRAVRKELFSCPYCPEQHPWETLRCKAVGAGILGRLVYPSLQASQAKGFVVFQITEDGVQFDIHQGSVLRLDSRVVAIKEGHGASLYRYEMSSKSWLREDRPLEPYHQLEGQAYAILL